MNKKVLLGKEARTKLINGINTLADAVTTSLGPNGRNTIYVSNEGQVLSTKDGVTISKMISNLEDPIEEMGVQLIKQAAIRTADTAGDGTTTSTLLAQSITNKGLSSLNDGDNATILKRDIDDAIKLVVNELKQNISEVITNENQLHQIAKISANNDDEVATLISTALNKAGRDGIVHIEESKTNETYLETVEGIQFDKGYKSHYFVTDNNTMSTQLVEPYILIADYKFNQAKDLLPILEAVSSTGKPLLIICDDIDGEALATLIVNKIRGTIKVCAVKAPDFGERKKLILEDIAIMTGGQLFSKDKGMKLDKFSWDWFGKCRNASITRDNTTIVDGKGNVDTINERADEIIKQIEKATTGFEKEKLQERLAKFSGGVSIIHVGSYTEAELKEKKDRVEDALFATKAAIDDGIVPGGGTALIRAASVLKDKLDTKGYNIVYESCFEPFRKILLNAGYTLQEIFSLTESIKNKKDKWFGYDLKTKKIVNLKDAGIIDPCKVTVKALQNSSSVAGTILLTETIIYNKVDKKEQEYNNEMLNY